MNWLERRRERRRKQQERLEQWLTFASEENAISFRRVRDLGSVLQAIEEVFPRDAILCVEGSRRAMAPEVLELLEANPAPQPRDVWPGTTWPKSQMFHIVAAKEHLERLRELEGRHAAPEICDHLVVYRGDEVLLHHHDAGDGAVLVARTLGEANLARIAEILGMEPEKPL